MDPGLRLVRGDQLGLILALSVIPLLFECTNIISSNSFDYTKGKNTKKISGPKYYNSIWSGESEYKAEHISDVPQKHPHLEGPQILNLSVPEQGSPSELDDASPRISTSALIS